MAALGGSVAQSVEQRTENPCVAGSIPAGATICFPLRPAPFLKSRFDANAISLLMRLWDFEAASAGTRQL